MTGPQCVAIAATAEGAEYLRPVHEAPCTTGLLLMDPATYQAVQQSPFFITMDQAPGFMLALLGLFVAAYVAKGSRRALD